MKTWWWMVPLLLVVTAITASKINADAIWLDEERTYAKVQGGRYGQGDDISAIFNYTILTADSWPPLYNLTFMGWGHAAGWSPYAMRAMALLWGVLSLAMVYRAGASIGGSDGVGLMAAVITGTSFFYLYYFHEMRGYTMAVFFALLGVTMYWHLLQGRGGRPYEALLVFSGVALLYSHYIVALVLVGIGLYHLLVARGNPAWNRLFFLLVVTALLFVPWGLVMVRVVSTELAASRSLPPTDIFVGLLYGVGNGLFIWMPTLVLLATLRVKTPGGRYLMFLAGTYIVVALLANVPLDYLLHIRHIMLWVPLLALVAATALVTLPRWVTTTLVGIWVLAGLWGGLNLSAMTRLPNHEQLIHGEIMQTAVDLAQTQIHDDDVLVFYVTDDLEREWLHEHTQQHYLGDPPFDFANLWLMRDVPTTYDQTLGILTVAPSPEGTYAERVTEYVDGAPRVWLLKDLTIPQVDSLDEFQSAMLELGYGICATNTIWETQIVEVIVWAEDCMAAIENGQPQGLD